MLCFAKFLMTLQTEILSTESSDFFQTHNFSQVKMTLETE